MMDMVLPPEDLDPIHLLIYRMVLIYVILQLKTYQVIVSYQRM